MSTVEGLARGISTQCGDTEPQRNGGDRAVLRHGSSSIHGALDTRGGGRVPVTLQTIPARPARQLNPHGKYGALRMSSQL